MSVTHNPYQPFCSFCAACTLCPECCGSECCGSPQYPSELSTPRSYPSSPAIFSPSNSNNIYVRNLPSSVDDDWLRRQFSPFGLITSAKVMTNHNRKSKGYGFIQYTDQQMAVLAVEKMNGFVVGQHTLCVKLADRDKDRGIFNQPSTNLYVSNLPRDYGVSEISVLFAPYGSISSMVVLTDGHNGGSRGVSLVRYYSIESASTAIAALHGRVIPGHDRPLEVKFAENQEEKHLRKNTVHKSPLFNSKQRAMPPRRDYLQNYFPGTKFQGQKEEFTEQVYQQAILPNQSSCFDSAFASEEMLPKMDMPTDSISAPLHVYGIDPNLNELELYKLFAPYGAIVSVKMEDSKTRKPLFASMDEKCCVVQFRSNPQAAEAVKSLSGASLNGKLLTVVVGEQDNAGVSLLPAGA